MGDAVEALASCVLRFNPHFEGLAFGIWLVNGHDITRTNAVEQVGQRRANLIGGARCATRIRSFDTPDSTCRRDIPSATRRSAQ